MSEKVNTILKAIMDFRKLQKPGYASTSHVIRETDYELLAPYLIRYFTEFTVLRIQSGRHRNKIEIKISGE